MKSIPTIQMRVEIPAEQISAAIAMRQEEISAHIREGVEHAVREAANTMVEQAYKQASAQISQEINSYFAYGEGRETIKAAVLPTLAKITRQILKAKS